MDPVDLDHLHKTVYGIFGKVRSVFPNQQIHIYASVRKYQKKEVLENLSRRRSLLFVSIGRF